ncbi:MAG: ribonucleoside-diphosphate reductase subunit alpha [Halobacteriota archaeon]
MTKIKYQGIMINEEDPAYITKFSKTLLDDFYKREDESISQALSRPAVAYCYGDYELAQRIYDYAHNGWFMYASPVLSNAMRGRWEGFFTTKGNDWCSYKFVPEEKQQGQPISCFAFDVGDTTKDQVAVLAELANLSLSGGGTGAHMSIRAIGGKAPGPIPYMKVMDSAIGYFRQGKTRKGAIAAYLNVDHPDIVEHIRFRKPGGDSKRRSDNRQQFHNAVNVTDVFIEAVMNDTTYDLVCPHSGKVHDTLRAREVWEEILETRALTGEPYLMKSDLVNRKMPESQKKLGLKIRGSNLCSEITLPTDDERTFVCCLSSLNMEKYEEWKDSTIVEDLIRFLDNVLQSFIDTAPDSLHKAKYSAERERAVGLGTLGWHGYLQSKGIPFESGGFDSAIHHTSMLYNMIRERAEASSRQLAKERGEPEDMKGTGMRNSRVTAIAPNANSADLLDTSPTIEPYFRNVFLKSTRAGNFKVKNRHLQKVLQGYGMDTDDVWDSINANDGKVDHLEFLTEHEKLVFKVSMEIDMHWVIEQAEARGEALGGSFQSQSLNVFFPFGSSRKYVNSVHLKFLKSPNVTTMYYYRSEREGNADNAKKIERKALVDWTIDECVACSG